MNFRQGTNLRRRVILTRFMELIIGEVDSMTWTKNLAYGNPSPLREHVSRKNKRLVPWAGC